jgi:hypothetical protein
LFPGAQYISDGLIKGAEKVGELMNYGTPKLIQKITPETAPQPVNPKVSRGLQVAKDVTGTAVQITSYMGENTSFYMLKSKLIGHMQVVEWSAVIIDYGTVQPSRKE